jgi:YHS domain-containing protein
MKKSAFWMAAPALLLAALAYNNFSVAKKTSSSKATCTQLTHDCSSAPDTLRKDPICGMMADDTKRDTVHYKNSVYAFCSKHCKEEFVKNPSAHVPKKKTN